MPLRSRGLTALPAQKQPVTVWDAANWFEFHSFPLKGGKFQTPAAKDFEVVHETTQIN